jgi:hypothetical protein
VIIPRGVGANDDDLLLGLIEDDLLPAAERTGERGVHLTPLAVGGTTTSGSSN